MEYLRSWNVTFLQRLIFILSGFILITYLIVCSRVRLRSPVFISRKMSKMHLCNNRRPTIQYGADFDDIDESTTKRLDDYIATRRKHLITYGDEKFAEDLKRIKKEAEDSGYFDYIKTFSRGDLSQEFSEKYKDLLSRPRGGGYWIWKMFVLRETLKKMRYGDFLLYIDADCGVKPGGQVRLQEYYRLVNLSKTGMLAYGLNPQERVWTTDKIFKSVGVWNKWQYWTSSQLAATVFYFQKTKHVLKLLKMWKALMDMDPLVITDDYNANTTRIEFRENRHEQSVLSIYRKCLGVMLPNDGQGKMEPIKW